MSGRKRVELAGSTYHVCNEGVASLEMLAEKEDRQAFLGALAATVERLGWLCRAWCLLPNRYHLLFETPGAIMAAGMQYLGQSFSRLFNARRG